ncbi:tRNA(Met) cytidine acetyltransferase TmcA [Pasteurella multocida]
MGRVNQQRKVQCWVGENDVLFPPLARLSGIKSAVWIGDDLPPFLSFAHFDFKQAKNMLGQEFALIVYDARGGLNLDALAIASGTLQQDGVLLILLPQWATLSAWHDPDSVRWSGENCPILTPHFLRYFQQKVQEYGFPIHHTFFPSLSLPNKSTSAVNFQSEPTVEQAQLLHRINKATEAVLIVTAKRGRGKSALAGFWARQLKQQNQTLILTAPNKAAVRILQAFANTALDFKSPDLLCEQIAQDPHAFADKWLLIDEAAMLPLSLLELLTSTFKGILCTTTIQSYEGTGRGFLLKFLANLDRTFAYFELHQPLRWQADDKLEAFMDDLLLLHAEDLPFAPLASAEGVQFQRYSQHTLYQQQKIAPLYGLLTRAHYRTSPLDLRRLFDAPNQHFYLAQKDEHLLGAAWLVQEGSLQSEQLIAEIERGLRRPRGNLVPQLLCFQAHLPQACRLSSLRISRIAVQPDWQQQGIGQQLVKNICQDAQVDFLSVSFGYTTKLAAFWQKCGFLLVHLGEQKEASSGCYAVIGLKPLSPAGISFCQQAYQQFQRNLSLSRHPLATAFPSLPTTWQLDPQDWRALVHFAYFQGSFTAALPAIQRLLAQTDRCVCPLLSVLLQPSSNEMKFVAGKKSGIKICREEVKKLLQNHTAVLS